MKVIYNTSNYAIAHKFYYIQVIEQSGMLFTHCPALLGKTQLDTRLYPERYTEEAKMMA